MSDFQSLPNSVDPLERADFDDYLSRSGVISAIAHSLACLSKETNKPEDPDEVLEYICTRLSNKPVVDINQLRAKAQQMRCRIAELDDELMKLRNEKTKTHDQ